MAIKKRPYELSIWIEKLNEDGKKDEIKGAIIGAHDMDYLGRATNIVLKRELKGTNTLTFQMPDSYFDSLIGNYVKNDFIDNLIPERKIKLFYRDEWFEFFIKKISEKKILNSYIKTFTCTDAFIDELSRNGYGLTFEEDLYNNVDEIGNFTEEVLEDSLWHYTPEYNWGDFSEFTEERLYKIPISQFGEVISGYRIPFGITEKQKEKIGAESIKNVYTKKERDIELSDDISRGLFWDQQNFDNANGEKENSLLSQYIENIDNDGYIYVPYTCLNFCYGSENGPDEQIKYDRAATEVALKVDNNYVLSPQSVDPKTLIQFLAIPKNAKIEIDEDGVILNKEYQYFMTLKQWNEKIINNIWYFFEDTRLVKAETLGAEDLANATISHTFRYLYNDKNSEVLNSYKESYGNKVVKYSGYLEDEENLSLKGRKYSITDRTEINISEEIDQYVKVYNNSPDEYASNNENLYSSSDWKYEVGVDNKYRVCSKTATRQIIPQLSRNLIQNGINIQSIDGWAPMRYLNSDANILTGSIELRTILEKDNTDGESVKGTVLYYSPPHKELAYVWKKENEEGEEIFYQINGDFYLGESSGEQINTFTILAEKNSDKYKEYRRDGVQVKNKDTQKNKIHKIYANKNQEEYDIYWKIDSNTYNYQIQSEDFNVLNFGMIGQNKVIEKDKIYCLGIELLVDSIINSDSFGIFIGQGSLISEGDYSFTNKVICVDKEQLFGDSDISNSELDWDNFDDSTYTIPNINFKDGYILFRAPETIENPYIAIHSKGRTLFKKIEFFEAYTKGHDSFETAPYYRYSGRDLFGTEQPEGYQNINWNKKIENEKEFSYYYSLPFSEEEIRKRIIFEDMIMLGTTYEYQQYFIQRLKAISNENEINYYDTCGVKEFISSENLQEGVLPLDGAKYTEDNYTIETNYINLNKCKYYDAGAAANECDCKYGSTSKAVNVCYYQKFGYCPYRFQTEKHDRKIRTLKVSKSNRFNIIQEESKVFKVYPQFYINHKDNGRINKNKDGLYEKQVFFITEKGNENKIGFKYKKNLKDISRDLESDKIVTKLYVQDVDSELSKTGLCSIKTAEDNISKDSFVIDFSYYIKKGILDKDEVERDLYGNYVDIDNNINQYGYLRKLGYYNEQYDNITNKIINLQDSSFIELEANLNVNLDGILAVQEQLNKIKKQMEHFAAINTNSESQSYLNYKTKKEEQESILLQLIYDTFYTEKLPEVEDKYYDLEKYGTEKIEGIDQGNPNSWFKQIKDFNKMKETWVGQHLYTKGILGQYNKEYNQIQAWKKERASYLKMINKITEDFYKKYEPYLKEGTWSDSNYLNDNAYYFGALDVSAQGAIPKVNYNISVIGLDIFEEYEDIYNFYLADTTWVEDEGMFGVNPKTGLPNRLKVLISEINYNLDEPMKDSIKIQNYTTKFEDLFQQVAASVQSLQYNENIYKRSSNFTALKNIETDSLQGTLDQNNLTLLNTAENNIQLNSEGTKGSDINNHANKYKQNGQGIYFSNDGGQHWSVGVGPSGINADYIKVGSLDASKIRIIDGNYIYFNWDKNGINAYRNPQGINTTDNNISDFACFNKYGLSIYNNNCIKLRAGYSFNGENGEIFTEDEAGENIGFYLYNNYNQQILAAENNTITSASQIRLFGELMATCGVLEEDNKIYSYKYSNLITIFEGNGVLIDGEKEKGGWKLDIITSIDGVGEKIYNEPKRIFIDGKIGVFDGFYQISPFSFCYIYKYKDVWFNGNYYNKLYLIQDKSYSKMIGNSCFYINGEEIENEVEYFKEHDDIIGFSRNKQPVNGYIAGNIGAKKYMISSNKNAQYANYNIIKDQIGYLFKDNLTENFYLVKEKNDKQNNNTVIYLNNKTGLIGTDGTKPKRILSLVRQEDTLIKNYFTIFEDGTIIINGTINEENIYELSDTPTINGGTNVGSILKLVNNILS